MEGKKSKGSLIVIIILVLLVIGLVGYIAYDKLVAISNSKEVKEVEEKKETTTKILGVYDDVVREALEEFSVISIDYEKDVKDMSAYERISTAIFGLKKEQINYCRPADTKITLEELNKSLTKKIPDAKITLEDIKSVEKDKTYPGETYGFDSHYGITLKGNDIYVIGSCDGSGPGLRDYEETTLDKAEMIGDNLYLYQKISYVKVAEYDETTDTVNYNICKDKDGKEVIQKNEIYYNIPKTIEWQKYNTYKLKFKRVDGKYYYQGSEKE